LETTEDGGAISELIPNWFQPNALERGKQQLGTLGSGNHFSGN
jgi:tRNA-splicing ligase RtcB